MSGRWTKAAALGLLVVTLAGCSTTAAPKKKGTAAEPVRNATAHVTRGTDRMIRGATGRGSGGMGTWFSGLWGGSNRGSAYGTGTTNNRMGAGMTRGTYPTPATGTGGARTGGTGASFGASSTRMGPAGTGLLGGPGTRTGNTGLTGAAGTRRGTSGASMGGMGGYGMSGYGMGGSGTVRGTTGAGRARGMTGASSTRMGAKGTTSAAGTTSGKKPLRVVGFFTEDASKKGLVAIGRDPKALSDLSPWWYTVQSDGSIKDTSTPATRAWATKHKMPLIPLVTNGGEYKVLTDDTAMRTAIENLTQIAHKNNYAGLNVDFQGLPSSARNGLNAFVDDLSHNLHAMNKTVAVDIIPTQAQTGTGGAYDEVTLSHYADYLVLMTYDRHDNTSPPGPVSPHNWVVGAVKHALAAGVPANKILLGVNSYGYNWNLSTGKGTTVGQAQATSTSGTKTYSSTTKENKVTYTRNGVKHVIYYGGRRSLADKLAIARQYKLAGIAIWKVGYEDQAYWQELLTKNGDASSTATSNSTSGTSGSTTGGSAASGKRTGHAKPMTHRPIGTRTNGAKNGATTHGGTARSQSGKARGTK
jgi:spore germination protein YaaH